MASQACSERVGGGNTTAVHDSGGVSGCHKLATFIPQD